MKCFAMISHFFSSFRGKIVLSVLIPFLILMVSSLIFVITAVRKILQRTVENDIDLYIQQVNDNFSNQLNTLYNLNMLLVSDEDLVQQLSDTMPPRNTYEAAIQRIALEEKLENSSIVTTYSLSTVDNGSLLERIYLFRDSLTFFKAIFRNRGAFETDFDELFSQIYIKRRSGNDSSIGIQGNVLWYSFDFNDPDTGQFLGTLLYQLNTDALTAIPASILYYQDALWQIGLEDGTVLLSSGGPNVSFPGKASSDLTIQQVNGVAYFANHYYIPQFGLTLSLLVPQSQMRIMVARSLLVYATILLAIAAMVQAICLLLVSRVMRPFQDLTHVIRQIEQGNLQAKLPDYGDTEFQELSKVFNEMTDRIDYLVNDVYQKQLLITQSELRTLQAQMNPHFIFNVLNTISLQAQMDGNEKVSQMVYSLSQLLQEGIIKKGEEKIPLARELEYAKFYVSLQNDRFNGKIHYQVNCTDQELLDLYIPKLTLQPLIENAVIHGLEPKYGEGHLAVNIYHADNSLFIEVIDDGVGFTPEPSLLYGSMEESTVNPGHKKIGLVNSDRILRHFYGIGYGLSVVSAPGSGCRVTLHIPVDTGETEKR